MLTSAVWGTEEARQKNIGAVMVTAPAGLEDTLGAVRYHHEPWDGNGYPFGLRGEETLLLARLITVADAFSAIWNTVGPAMR